MDPAQTLVWPWPFACVGKFLFLLGLVQLKIKPKLRLKQRRLYSMAREWRSGNFVHKWTPRTPGKKDLILKSEDTGRRSEANAEELCTVVYQGRGRACWGRGVLPSFVLFWSLTFSFGAPLGSACNETLDGLRVRFIAILIPAGYIWFLFFPSYSFLSYFQTLWLRDLYWLLLKVGVGEF